MIQFDEHIFQMGWNCQPISTVTFWTSSHGGWEDSIFLSKIGWFLGEPAVYFSGGHILISQNFMAWSSLKLTAKAPETLDGWKTVVSFWAADASW